VRADGGGERGAGPRPAYEFAPTGLTAEQAAAADRLCQAQAERAVGLR
jgi:hypothetical protein